MTEPLDSLDAGLAAAFGPDSAPATVDDSVLHALGFPAGSLPRVQLRDPSTEPPSRRERWRHLLHQRLARGDSMPKIAQEMAAEAGVTPKTVYLWIKSIKTPSK
jgi:hypothetical protein